MEPNIKSNQMLNDKIKKHDFIYIYKTWVNLLSMGYAPKFATF